MRTNRKPLAGATGAAKERTNCGKCTTCRCAEQMQIPGFPPHPDPFKGPLVDWLEANPGWWGRTYLCAAVGVDERTLRLQAEHSAGRVVFSSGSGGLCATIHADDFMVKNCAAELRNRAASHLRRASEVEAAWAEIGAAR